MKQIVEFIQEQLEEIRANFYHVSSERNIKADLKKTHVVVSSLSGDVYSKSSNIPYQIEIVTRDVDTVQADFFTLGRNCNNVAFTKVISAGSNNFESITYSAVFNTPVAVEKDIAIGANRYVRLVAFVTVNEITNVNQIKNLKIDGEKIETLNSTYGYLVETNSNRISGDELTRSKKKASSVVIAFVAISISSVFFNKAFQISCGQLSGNTSFSVEYELLNGLKATSNMIITGYEVHDERSKLPTVNVSLGIFDTRGTQNG